MTIPNQKKERVFIDPEPSWKPKKETLCLAISGAIVIPIMRMLWYYIQTGMLFKSETDIIITLVAVPIIGAVCVPLLYYLLIELKNGMKMSPR
jgi:acyl-CoA synthetase (AMP-forming)/AMP-acid ligase II